MVTDVGMKEQWQGQCVTGSWELWIIIFPVNVLALTSGWEPAMSPVNTLEPNQFLSLQAKLKQYLIRKSVLLVNNKIWSSNKKVCKMFEWICFLTPCFQPCSPQTWPQQWPRVQSSLRGEGNKNDTSYLTREKTHTGCPVCGGISRSGVALLIMSSRQLNEDHRSLTLMSSRGVIL